MRYTLDYLYTFWFTDHITHGTKKLAISISDFKKYYSAFPYNEITNLAKIRPNFYNKISLDLLIFCLLCKNARFTITTCRYTNSGIEIEALLDPELSRYSYDNSIRTCVSTLQVTISLGNNRFSSSIRVSDMAKTKAEQTFYDAVINDPDNIEHLYQMLEMGFFN